MKIPKEDQALVEFAKKLYAEIEHGNISKLRGASQTRAHLALWIRTEVERHFGVEAMPTGFWRDESSRSTGALPPSSLAWQVGRTVETLDFVRECEKWLQQTGHPESTRAKIRFAIQVIKNNRVNLTKPLTAAEYLKALESLQGLNET